MYYIRDNIITLLRNVMLTVPNEASATCPLIVAFNHLDIRCNILKVSANVFGTKKIQQKKLGAE